MGTVFISYRREETAGEARALFGALVARLGENSVFMDVDNIELGRDFRQVLQERLASCDLLLALIGRDWVNAKNASGQRRLEDPADFVRLEIEAALKRNIPVTPVLVQGAHMPAAEQLPENLRDFAYRNGFELSHNRWESDVQEMLRRLRLGEQRVPGSAREIAEPPKHTSVPPATRMPWPSIVGASAVVIAIAIGGFLYYGKTAKETTPTPADAERSKAAPPAAKAPETVSVANSGKIEKAVCTDLGDAKYRVNLWGWASGEVGSLVWAGPRFSPSSGVPGEAKISCLAWGPASPDDGPIHPRACKRAQGQPGKTPWSSENTLQWKTAGSPNVALVAVRGPRPSGGADPVTVSDTITLSCGKS